MSVPVRDFLRARRDRSLGAILGYAEREIYPKLSPVEQTAFRKTVLESLNSYHDSALDLFKSDTGTVRNDELISLLARIEERLEQ